LKKNLKSKIIYLIFAVLTSCSSDNSGYNNTEKFFYQNKNDFDNVVTLFNKIEKISFISRTDYRSCLPFCLFKENCVSFYVNHGIGGDFRIELKSKMLNRIEDINLNNVPDVSSSAYLLDILKYNEIPSQLFKELLYSMNHLDLSVIRKNLEEDIIEIKLNNNDGIIFNPLDNTQEYKSTKKIEPQWYYFYREDGF
jgi:hypothetical protein